MWIQCFRSIKCASLWRLIVYCSIIMVCHKLNHLIYCVEISLAIISQISCRLRKFLSRRLTNMIWSRCSSYGMHATCLVFSLKKHFICYTQFVSAKGYQPSNMKYPFVFVFLLFFPYQGRGNIRNSPVSALKAVWPKHFVGVNHSF